MVKKQIIQILFLFLFPTFAFSFGCDKFVVPTNYTNIKCGIPSGCDYDFGWVIDIEFYNDKAYIVGMDSTQITVIDIDYNPYTKIYNFTIAEQLNETELGINATCSAYGKCAGSIAYDPEENRIFYNYWSDVEKGLLIYDFDTNSVTYKNSTYGSCWLNYGGSEMKYSTKYNMLAWAQGCVGLILFNPSNNSYRLVQSFSVPSYPPSPQPSVEWCDNYIITHGGNGFQKHSTWVYNFLTDVINETSLQTYDPYMWVDCSEKKVYQSEILEKYYPIDFDTITLGTPISFYTTLARGEDNSACFDQTDRIFVVPKNYSFEIVDRDLNKSVIYCENASKWISGSAIITDVWYNPNYELVFGSSPIQHHSLFIWGKEVEKGATSRYYCGQLGLCFASPLCFFTSVLEFIIGLIVCILPMLWLAFFVGIAIMILFVLKGFGGKFN